MSGIRVECPRDLNQDTGRALLDELLQHPGEGVGIVRDRSILVGPERVIVAHPV